jgi:hypothetical protein
MDFDESEDGEADAECDASSMPERPPYLNVEG